MQTRELLIEHAAYSFRELLESIEGLSEQQSWARVELLPDEYLHSEGSILSTVVHVAAAKQLYGSCAYRDKEVRWRDMVAQMESFWPSWEDAKKFLQESHDYWLGTWATESDFTRPVKTFRDADWPSWKVIYTICHHDSYHAGQIQLMRSMLQPTDTPPPAEGDLWRKYCGELPSW
ncbi:MAG TPA: DinB family protein [Fimbriimonadaceae bacterium]|nr:DinB family protein [Fimbriimonadaceae bacterium]